MLHIEILDGFISRHASTLERSKLKAPRYHWKRPRIREYDSIKESAIFGKKDIDSDLCALFKLKNFHYCMLLLRIVIRWLYLDPEITGFTESHCIMKMFFRR